MMARAFQNVCLSSLIVLSLVATTSSAGGGDRTWQRFQASRAYLNNSNGYYGNPATVVPPAPVTAANGTYRSYSAEPGQTAPPVLQLYYYVDAGYYHYYYAPPRVAAPPAPGTPLPVPKHTEK
jgi:hypothetical protein